MAKDRLTPQDVYLKRVQTDYKAYCYYVHNHGAANKAWIPSRFHVFLCDTIQEFVERETDKAFEILIINTPPQHGKSTTVTETYPAFFLSRNPTKKAILISYGDDLAERFGKRNLEKIKTYGNLFGIGLNKKKSTSREFELSNNLGRLISKGLGSGITGHSGDLILMDDPIKNRMEADSETRRNAIWSEFEDTVKSRTSAGAKVVLIMTRWHEDDLAGRIVKEYPDRTTVVNLPCEAEENDLLGRDVGDALCPEIGKDNDWLSDFKTTFTSREGARGWNALYQGRPTSQEGNMIKREWWQYYDYADYAEGRLIFDTMLISVDATFKDQEKNDYVAIEVWGKRRANMYLVDLVNEHLDFPNTIRAIRGMKALYPRTGAILIEDKANGSAIIQVMRSEIPGIIAVLPVGGKEARVNAILPAVEAGNCYLPRDRGFTGMFVDQCAAFPNGKHDDMVDACFAAGTKVATPFGDKNIEDFKVGDKVLTPFGIRHVTACGYTGEHIVINKFGIIGTPNHRFFTKKGFVKMDSLTQGIACDILSIREMISWRLKKLLCSMVLSTDLWGKDAITFLNQIQMRDANMRKDFMSLFGSFTTGKKFLMVVKFITLMGIVSITTLATLSVYHSGNIVECIRQKVIKSKKNISKKLDLLLKRGTRPKRGKSGIGSTLRRVLERLRQKNIHADSVVRLLWLKFRRSIAHTTAPKNNDTVITCEQRRENVSYAEKNLQQMLQPETMGRTHVAKVVNQNLPTGTAEKIKTYNLTVEKDHLYYAGGFLVANCSQGLARLIFTNVSGAIPEKKNPDWNLTPKKKPGVGKGDKINVI